MLMSQGVKTASEIEARVSSAKRDAALVQVNQDQVQQKEDLILTVKIGIDSANSLKVGFHRPVSFSDGFTVSIRTQLLSQALHKDVLFPFRASAAASRHDNFFTWTQISADLQK